MSAKILNFEDFLSRRELARIEAWATQEFAAPVEKQKVMDSKPLFVLVCKREGKTIESNTGFTSRVMVENFVNSLNRKFPDRRYYFKTEVPKIREAKANL